MLLPAVEDGPVVVQGGPALLDVLHHVVIADDEQEGLLLPGKAGVVQILGGTAGADGHRLAGVANLAVEPDDVLGHFLGNGGADDALPDLGRDGDQRCVAGEVDGVQLFKDIVPEAVGLHECVEHL